MSLGTPDYDINNPRVNEIASSDILELASRLNAIATINRSGQQIISIGETIAYLSGAHVYISSNGYFIPAPKWAIYGRTPVKFVTAAGASDYAGLTFTHLPFNPTKIGLAGYFLNGSLNYTLYMDILTILGGVQTQSGIKYNIATGNIYVLNPSNTYDLVTNVLPPSASGQAYTLKFTVDLTTGEYMSLFYGSENLVDLSSHFIYNPAVTPSDSIVIHCYIQNNSAVSNNIYIQDTIVTINEVM